MTNTEAAAILNVNTSASPDDVRRAYQELFSEYQFRLTNAPTPSLKNLYHGRLRELDEARATLVGVEPDQIVDLPTNEPTYTITESAGGPAARGTPQAPQPRFTPPAGGAAYTNAPRRDTTPPPEPSGPAPSDKSRVSDEAVKQPNKNLITAAAIVAAIALVVFFETRRGKSDESSSKQAHMSATGVVSPVAQSSTDTFGPADSAVRNNIALAKFDFGRADYLAGALDLDSAALHLGAVQVNPTNKVAIELMRTTIADLRAKIRKACLAARAEADRRGADLPKCPQ